MGLALQIMESNSSKSKIEKDFWSVGEGARCTYLMFEVPESYTTFDPNMWWGTENGVHHNINVRKTPKGDKEGSGFNCCSRKQVTFSYNSNYCGIVLLIATY